MVISQLTLENFRNLQNPDLRLNQGFLVLVGPNGAGKTNFLESIYFAASLRRFPESQVRQLFQEGKSFLRVKFSAVASEEPVTQEVFTEISEEKISQIYKINNVPAARNQYTGLLPVISFLPQDLNLLTRSPGNRRRYLNETLSLVSAQYRYTHRQYEQALKQRNQALQYETPPTDLEIWNEKLAEYGSFVCTAREIFLNYLNQNLGSIVSLLSPELLGLKFLYQMSAARSKQEFLAKLKANFAKDFESGSTSSGPHRDDFQTRIDSKEAVGYLSRGQIRSLTLALKFLEKQYVQEKLERNPILLLDDVFSEFDTAHQQKLAEFLKSFEQVFLTTTHWEEVKDFLPSTTQIYEIDNGLVKAHV